MLQTGMVYIIHYMAACAVFNTELYKIISSPIHQRQKLVENLNHAE